MAVFILLAYLGTLIFIAVVLIIRKKNSYNAKIKIDSLKSFSLEIENKEKSPDTIPPKE